MNPLPARRTSPSSRILLIGALLAGFALRSVRLSGESLWYDETVSVFLAQRSLPALLAHTAGDIHPPGYYLLLQLWGLIARPTVAHGLEYLYAWVSLACAMIILALLWPIGQRLVGRVGTQAGLLIATAAPFHIWYAQEVRMYALGGALGLLCLLALLRWFDGRGARWLAVYALAAAAGIYTFYYFLFLLAALALCALLQTQRRRDLWPWLGANGAALILFAPWLGIFWRQATDPPVPPWRAAWSSAGDFGASVSEALGALLLGQTRAAFPWLPWVIAMAALSMVIAFAAGGSGRGRDRGTLLLYVLAPLLLIFVASLAITPIYHVRYLFPAAAPFALVAGAVVAALWRRRAGLGAALLAVILAASGVALADFWRAPALRADDHRGAVQALARNWRPGDVILVNAGWAWTALEVYWPREQALAPLPPDLAAPLRLTNLDALDLSGAGVPLIVSGSVNGATALGWGSATSDFYAIPAAQVTAALEGLATRAARLWHYRLYDTVSDPRGLMRAWLEAHTVTEQVSEIPGRDFGRVELRRLSAAAPTPSGTFEPVHYANNTLRLLDAHLPSAVAAGSTLYVPLLLEGLPGLVELGTGLSSSLRLVDGSGVTVAQQDGPFSPPSSEWRTGTPLASVLAVGVPADAAGPLAVELVLYRQDDAAALPTQDPRALDGQRLRLGMISAE